MDFGIGWGALLNTVVEAFGKYLDIALVKKLREHSDEFLKLEKALHTELQKPYDDMDDFAIAAIKHQMKLVKEAFERDLSIGMKAK